MGKYARFFKSATHTVDYWTQVAIRQFVLNLMERMDRLEMKKVDLAKNIGASPAYITKVMRGDANFTLETMTKLAMAVGGKVSVKITDHVTIETATALPHAVTCNFLIKGDQRFDVSETTELRLVTESAANEFSFISKVGPQTISLPMAGAA